MKAAQGPGLTTTMIIKQLVMVHNYNLESIYTLPSQSDVNTMVRSKVNRIIQHNPIFQTWVKDQDTIEQKQVGSSQIYYRGTFTEQQALMIASDLNIFDEEDRSKAEIISQYSSRQQASSFRWNWHLSNPSVDGAGVSQYWPKSTQAHWFVKCNRPGCCKEQFMSWPDSVDPIRQIYVCKYCSAPLSDEQRRAGRWVKKVRDAQYSGYWIPLFISTMIPAKKIIDDFQTKPRQFFYNFVLGLPYIGEGNKLTEEDLLKNCTPDINTQRGVVIGVDVGVVKHFVVGNATSKFWYGKTEEWDDIEKLLHRFPDAIMVIDNGPDITMPRHLIEKYPQRVWRCVFNKDRKGAEIVRWSKKNIVLADRSKVIQDLVDGYIEGRLPLQGNRADWRPFYDHWAVLYRTADADLFGNTVFEWRSATNVDHWALADVYWRVGMDRINRGKPMMITSAPPGVNVEAGVHINPDGTAPLPQPDKIFNVDNLEEEDWRDL